MSDSHDPADELDYDAERPADEELADDERIVPSDDERVVPVPAEEGAPDEPPGP